MGGWIGGCLGGSVGRSVRRSVAIESGIRRWEVMLPYRPTACADVIQWWWVGITCHKQVIWWDTWWEWMMGGGKKGKGGGMAGRLFLETSSLFWNLFGAFRDIVECTCTDRGCHLVMMNWVSCCRNRRCRDPSIAVQTGQDSVSNTTPEWKISSE